MNQRESVRKMRLRIGKWAIMLLLLSVLFVQQSVYAASVTTTEDFSTNTYSGGTGDWVGDWVASDDTNPATNPVRAVGGEARFRGANTTSVNSLYRTVQLGGATSAQISMTYRETGNLDAAPDDTYLIQLCSDTSFTNCQTLADRFG